MRIQPPPTPEKMPADQFDGEVELEWLSTPQTLEQRASVARVRFAAGARTTWHTHVRGQTLHVTEGVARIGVRGGEVVEARPGESVYIDAGEEHWHGASDDGPMEHIAVLEDGDDPYAAVTWLESVSAAEATAPASPAAAPGAHPIPLGAPVQVLALRYTAMFGPKPFPEALLIHLDNGAYKILSPGEEHFGSYVSATEPSADPRHVAYLSWPSEDWDRNVASHTLTFEHATRAFIQRLTLPGDPIPRAQHGYAFTIPDPHLVDMTASWEQVRATYADDFERLREHAAGR